MNLQEHIRRILREELSPRVRRRIDPDEMEKEFLESFESAYNLTKRRKVLSTHFLDELIYTTISMMMDGYHWRFTSTLPEDEFWYDDIHKELENHYRDRITQMYNERDGINESILKEETEIPAFLRRRFSPEDLEWLVNDVKEMIDDGESLDTAIYDGVREFVKSRKFTDIDEFGLEADYWESYLRYERPLVDYVKKKLRITNNVNESILREETEGINESILREEKETEFSTPFKRRLGRFTSFVWDNNVINYPCDFENFDSFIHGIHAEVMDMVSDGSDTDGPLSDWLTYIDAIRYIQRYMSDDLKEYYNRECVNKKLRITNNVNELILREEAQIPLPIKRRLSSSDLEEAFLISLDRIDYERRYSKMSIIKNASLQTFAKMVIDDMVTELEQEYFNDENRIYFDNDETYHEEIRVPLMNYFSNRIKKRYGPKDAKIVCQECGWSWNLSDGGDDPYTCHKCHPENE